MVYTINCSLYIMTHINGIYYSISNGIYIAIYHDIFHIISVHSSPTASMSPAPSVLHPCLQHPLCCAVLVTTSTSV